MRHRCSKTILSCAVAIVLLCGAGCRRADDEDKIIIRFADFHNQLFSEYRVATWIKEYLERESGGRIEVRLYFSGQLGATRETLEGTTLGTIHMTFADPGLLGSYLPEYAVMGLPFLFEDYEHLERVMDGPALAQLDARLARERSLRVLGWFHCGFRFFFGNVDINSLDDFKGRKFRSPEAEVFVEMMKAIGAVPVPLPYSDVYASLKTGVVDGAETTADGLYANKMWEVAKYLIRTDHMNTIDGLIINEKFYAGLPEDIRTLLDEAVAAAEVRQRRELREDEAMMLNAAREQGMIFKEVDRSEIRAAGRKVWEIICARYPDAAGIIARIEAARTAPAEEENRP